MSKKIKRLHTILEALNDIDFILNSKDFKITKAIEDKLIKPAIRMNIVRIA